ARRWKRTVKLITTQIAAMTKISDCQCQKSTPTTQSFQIAKYAMVARTRPRRMRSGRRLEPTPLLGCANKFIAQPLSDWFRSIDGSLHARRAFYSRSSKNQKTKHSDEIGNTDRLGHECVAAGLLSGFVAGCGVRADANHSDVGGLGVSL